MLISAASPLALPDDLVVNRYLVGTLALGVTIGRRLKSGSDFFLGGRKLPWWAIGISLGRSRSTRSWRARPCV